VSSCAPVAGSVTNNEDCNDDNANINPAATEVCNNVDDDCDGDIDEGLTFLTYYPDSDDDGYGSAIANGVSSCSPVAGSVTNNGDCDDDNANINPAATEVCNGIDDDCDGDIDEGVATTYYADADQDGYGNPDVTTQGCSQVPVGYVSNSEDCDDDNAAVNPVATEVCNGIDDDCDGTVDEGVTTTYYADTDLDSYGDPLNFIADCSAPAGYVSNSDDCDDTDPNVNPGGTEVCNGIDDNCDGSIDEGVTTTFYADVDQDGYGNDNSTTEACTAPAGYVPDGGDCDDTNANINPGATEVCNGIDDNCDFQIDEGVSTTVYSDGDADGYGYIEFPLAVCTLPPPPGYVLNSDDCDDSNAAINPAATEVCNGFDDDCDGEVDEGFTILTFYVDADEDGFGDAGNPVEACSAPPGTVSNDLDCDDLNADINPNATEFCNEIDDDCDGVIDEGVTITFYADTDQDGYGDDNATTQACTAPAGHVAAGGDCDDTDATVNPGATEVCDGRDEDCDGVVDDGVTTTFYADIDQDGYGDDNATMQACTAPAGHIATGGDCDDTDATVNPGATEVCDGRDEDCDGVVDDGVTTTFYADIDQDGYGDDNATTQACTAPAGHVATGGDCNDNDATVNPGATEVCDGRDEDCDGVVDDGVTTTFYADTDQDGYGDAAVTQQACTAPAGYVANSTDCDDGNAAINPGATEVCNDIDDDCNGSIDEGLQTQTYYADSDGDGFGDALATVTECSSPVGYVTNDDDCDDADATVFPGATEVCNDKDDDCDGTVDEGVTTTYYADTDQDGFGDANATTQACSVPQGYVTNDDDCDDSDPAIHPGATEVCNGKDDDCDGAVDEGVKTTFYADTDQDGFGNANATIEACSAPQGYVNNDDDCDDSNAAIHPGATEVCNGKDDDCDGTVDEGVTVTYYTDTDQDGYGNSAVATQACSAPAGFVAVAGDCNDSNASVNPGATEACNGIDDDCDGIIDDGVLQTFYADTDQDGFGNPNNTTQACSAPSGYVSNNTDCDDTKSAVRPGAPEICNNSIDDDCDGQIDETLIVWIGSAGSSWTNGANWNNGGAVPQSCNDIVIPANSNVDIPAGVEVTGKTLQVDVTAVLTMALTAIMTITP
jgi:hypothetical protein